MLLRTSVICRQRKIKCDGRKPCKTCTDAKRPARCEYPSITPLRDDHYVRKLEERVRFLSGQIEHAQGQNQHAPESGYPSDNAQGSVFQLDAVLPEFAASTSIEDTSSHDRIEEMPITGNLPREQVPLSWQEGSLPPESAGPHLQESTSTSTSDGQYLTTLASPSVSNRPAGKLDVQCRR